MTIVAAAIQYGDLVCTMPAPARHVDVRHAARTFSDPKAMLWLTAKDGFLNNVGAFLDRHEAMMHVHACGQRVLQEPNPALGLHTEDVW